MSAWAKASERSVLRQPSVEDLPLSPDATFQPQLVSNGALREKAPSSGYGKELPKAKDPSPLPLEDPEATFSPTLSNPTLRLKARSSSYGLEIPKLREEQEPPPDPEATFEPSLSNAELREKARSSQYGRVVAAAPALPEPEPLPFKPEITMTELAVALREKAQSQGYGEKILHKPVHEEPTIDRATFHPTLPKDKIRDSVASSGYMRNYTPEHKPRPKSAKASSRPATSQPATPRARQAVSAEEQQREEELKRRESGFRLDGVAVAGQLEVQMHYKQFRPSTAPSQTPTPLAQKIKDKARSSGYTKDSYTPERGEKPQPKEAEPPLSFRRNSAHDSNASDSSSASSTPAALALKAKYNEIARSAGYGSDWSPPKGEKRDTTPQPGFAPTKVSAGIPEPEPTPPRRLKSATNVQSSGYGSGYTPAKGEKKAIEVKGGMRVGGRPGIKPLSALDPPPRSALNDRVESHGYGISSPSSTSASAEPVSVEEPLTF